MFGKHRQCLNTSIILLFFYQMTSMSANIAPLMITERRYVNQNVSK